MGKLRVSAPALGVVALVAAAAMVLGGAGCRPVARRFLTDAAALTPAPAAAEEAHQAPPAPVVVASAPVASPSPDPALVPAASAGASVPESAAPPASSPYYGDVAVHTRAGRRYMAVLADPLAGIGSLPPGWTAASHTVVVGGLTRVYLTLAPAAVTGSVPVVVLMHGVMMTAAQILDVTQLATQTGPAIIVAPQGWEQSWNAGGCCGAAFRAGMDDVGFVRSALQQVLAANPAADPSRVYAVGFSNGGRMAYRLACDMPGVFAGFAAAEAVPVQNCSTLHPLSILIIAQQADPLITIDADRPPKWTEGVAEPTVAAVLTRERAMDGCAGGPRVTYTGVAERSIWNCAAGTRVTYVWYPGGSHSWRPPMGSTPGSTDMVLSLMGGQLLADRSVDPAAAHPAPAPSTTTTEATEPRSSAPTTSTTAGSDPTSTTVVHQAPGSVATTSTTVPASPASTTTTSVPSPQ